jgi:hypothetical protein
MRSRYFLSGGRWAVCGHLFMVGRPSAVYRRFAVLGLLLLCTASGFAQDRKCALKLADLPDAPELFGFRPGLTTEQVKARVPRITFGKVKDFGVSQTTRHNLKVEL